MMHSKSVLDLNIKVNKDLLYYIFYIGLYPRRSIYKVINSSNITKPIMPKKEKILKTD